MAQRAWGVEAGVLAGGQVNADLHPGSYPNLIRVVGRGSGFPVTRRRLSVALIYSIPCAALLSPKGFGSEEGACRFVIAHVFSSPPTLPPHSSVLSHSYLLLKRRRRSVRHGARRLLHELFALPRGGPRKRKIPSFLVEISAKIEKFFDFWEFLKVYDSSENEDE